MDSQASPEVEEHVQNEESKERLKVLKEEEYQKERAAKVKMQQQRAAYQEARLREKRAFEAAKTREKKAKGPSFLERAGKAVGGLHLENDLFDDEPRRRKGTRKKKRSRGSSRTGRAKASSGRKAPSRRGAEYYEYLRLKRKFER